MSAEKLDRKTQALLALHDLGTRHGATYRSVLEGMKKEGFTKEEIALAAKAYGSHNE